MKKTFLVVLASVLLTGSELAFSQELDMRTRAGKAAAKRQKKVDALVGSGNMINSLSDKENRTKAKEQLKVESGKLKGVSKEGFSKLKDAWKNRKK